MTLHYSLLEDPLIRIRPPGGGPARGHRLPDVLAALAANEVGDFPALRPHQRHPWYALLVQLAALALHRTGQTEPLTEAEPWRDALRALTPEHPDDAPWCLVAPPEQPAFLQAPVPSERPETWKNRIKTPDALDMLVTSKNHDLKGARMRQAEPDDWLLALVSLQTQEGVLGSGNYGISRMNGGFASRPAVGLAPQGGWSWGRRWRRDLDLLRHHRASLAEEQGLPAEGGLGLVWLVPWDGRASLAFAALDPFYLEICRRVRLMASEGGTLVAHLAGSRVPRIEAKARNGVTGDPWIPIRTAEAKALTLGARGFHYKLVCDLLFGETYRPALAQRIEASEDSEGLVVLAQGVTRGQGKTEGYHERRIPLSRTVIAGFRRRQTDRFAAMAAGRVRDLGQMRQVLWSALAALFDQGTQRDKASDSAKDKASRVANRFEHAEDARFFEDLAREFEAEGAEAQEAERLEWLLGLAARAEAVLEQTLYAGPQSAERRYRARTAALGRFHGALRKEKSFPLLARHYRALAAHSEIAHEPV